MLVSIDLDDDAYTFATTYASAKGITLGAAISELLHRAAEAPDRPTSRLTTSRLGFLVRAKVGRGVTPEMVKELSEDDSTELPIHFPLA